MKKIFSRSVLLYYITNLVLLAAEMSANSTNAEVIIQLELENKKLKEENSALVSKIRKLEEENQQLKDLLKEQNTILEKLARVKSFTKKCWKSISETIKNLYERINEKVKEIEKKERKQKEE